MNGTPAAEERPRRIAIVRRGYSATGGAEKFLARFVEAATASGREVVLVNDRRWPEEACGEVAQRTLPARSPWAFACAVERARAAWGDDILFSFERLLGADCYRAGDGVHRAWLRRRSLHESALLSALRRLRPKQRQFLQLERRCFSEASTRAVIVNSRLVEREIRDLYGYPAERIHLVRNGLPAGYSRGAPGRLEARRALGLDEAGFLAAFVGSGWERKGLRQAQTALAAAGLPHAALVVAGRGPEHSFVHPATKFLGPQADPRALLAAADVFLLPTIYDPFSNASLEALAMGCPVVTTRANGCAEILREGITGSVVAETGDIKALADALRHWAADGRAGAAAADCRAAAAECSLEDNVRRTLEVLAAVAAERGSV